MKNIVVIMLLLSVPYLCFSAADGQKKKNPLGSATSDVSVLAFYNRLVPTSEIDPALFPDVHSRILSNATSTLHHCPSSEKERKDLFKLYMAKRIINHKLLTTTSTDAHQAVPADTDEVKASLMTLYNSDSDGALQALYEEQNWFLTFKLLQEQGDVEVTPDTLEALSAHHKKRFVVLSPDAAALDRRSADILAAFQTLTPEIDDRAQPETSEGVATALHAMWIDFKSIFE